jgi:hypothetical protein
MKLPVLFAILLTVMLFTSCNKEKYMSKGIITGYDGSECGCCGGFMINFNGETEPNQSKSNLIENSGELDVDPREDFPIYVKVSYVVNKDRCDKKFIRVTKFERR